MSRSNGIWINLVQNLLFVPLVVVAVLGALGFGLVELDKAVELTGSRLVFNGDTGAARTVLSVIAGSLITVAGLTFSLTLVVLQLASSQFSPRILRTFFGDRVTQITIGTFVGTFVYAIFALRSVGSFQDTGDFVPRIAVTVGAVLSIASVVLLIAFLHHVSRLVQASHVAGQIGRATLKRTDALHPDTGDPVEAPREHPLDDWRGQPSRRIAAPRPGFVQAVAADGVGELDGPLKRVAFLVRPGDFVASGDHIAELWPADAGDKAARRVLKQVVVADERDLHQDLDFGLRQLTDMAIKALSPSINDPTTAVTCIGYVRSVLVTLAGRATPRELRRDPRSGLEVWVPRRGFSERLDFMREIGRYLSGDARVSLAALRTLEAVVGAAQGADAPARAREACEVAVTIAGRACAEATGDADEQAIEHALARVRERMVAPRNGA